MSIEATILVVDDEAANHEIINARLSALSFEGRVASVFDGVEALEWLQSGAEPILMLLDLQMPRMTGHEVLDRLGTGDVGPPPDVLIVSSSERPEDIALPEHYGFVVDYLDKPPSAADLWRATSSTPSTGALFSAPV